MWASRSRKFKKNAAMNCVRQGHQSSFFAKFNSHFLFTLRKDIVPLQWLGLLVVAKIVWHRITDVYDLCTDQIKCTPALLESRRK